MTEGDLDHIAALVHERTGLVFPESRRVVAAAGVRRAMAAARVTDPARYAAALERDDALLDDLFAELTVGETYFFREPAQLSYIREHVLPQLRDLGRGVRVWSAGCASGEEPYTLSILLHEAGLAREASVLGTDLSRTRLRLAQRGRYGAWSMRGVPADVIDCYFNVRDGKYEIDASIRGPVEFRYLNLSADHFPSPARGVWGIDLLLCRNVLIYFDAPGIARVAAKLLDTLTEDGWLFLGASDPMLSELIPCEVVVTSAGLAYRRPARMAVRSTGRAEPITRPPVASRAQHPPAVPVEVPSAEPTEFPVTGDPDLVRAPADVGRAVAAPPQDAGALLSVSPPPSGAPSGAPAQTSREEDGWADRVRTLANLGRLREAGDACATALDRFRDSAELTYLHAVLLAEAGRHSESAAAARRALYLDRHLVVAHLALGSALRRTGDLSGARRALANALTLLDALPGDSVVPASGGEAASRLAAAARVQLSLLEAAA